MKRKVVSIHLTLRSYVTVAKRGARGNAATVISGAPLLAISYPRASAGRTR